MDKEATTRKLRIGVVGLGGIATRSHIPALAALSDAVITAGAEIDTYQANRTQQRFGIPRVYPTYQEMLEKEPLDAVYVCLPNSLHYQAASAALSKGIHVYCEKPVGLSSDECRKLAEQAEKTGLVLMPGYHLRFHDNFQRARELLEERRLGKILQVQASAVFSGPYRGWDPKSDWHFNPRSGGPLYDWGSHILDLLSFMTNLNIEVITATAQKSLPGLPLQDNIGAAFQARNKIVGSMNIAWGCRGNLLMIQIHGTAGSLLVTDDYFEHRTPTGGGLNKIGVLVANAYEIFSHKVGAVIRRGSGDTLYTKAAQYFIGAIYGKFQIQSNMRDAIHVHQALEAIEASIEQGIPVKCGTTGAAEKPGQR